MKKILVIILFSPFFFFAQKVDLLKLENEWRFTPNDNSAYAKTNFDDASWNKIEINKTWEKQGYPGHDGFAWYRIKFNLPSSMKKNSVLHDSLIINLGKIDDFDQTFLNGKLIGINGKNADENATVTNEFKNGTKTYWDVNRRYSLDVDDSRLKWDAENVIAIRVYDWGGPGGIYDNNAFVRMQLPGDYLKINLNGPFVHVKESWEKEISIQNISDAYKLKGTFHISVIQKIDGKTILEETRDITLRPDKSYIYKYAFPEQKQSCIAKYEVKLNNDKRIISASEESPYILTPPVKKEPKINGASVYGQRPGRPFLYKIPASGEKPIRYRAENLPHGLTLDEKTGIITGKVKKAGEYKMLLIAENKFGKAQKEFVIKIGETIALTPPMGWNSWNAWGLAVDEQKVKAAAEAFVKSGLIEHGWQYINIDDGWSIFETSNEPKRKPDGEIITNSKFPDMKMLGNYIHSLGLKFGIYSSPGPLTCGHYTASYKHELQDVKTFAKWGVDYLKYDLCSYRKLIPDFSKESIMPPYELMNNVLQKVNERDIVYSICEYGLARVWEWGEEAGGNLWRTTGDIWDEWDRMKTIGFEQTQTTPYAKPGHWNDPDMLVVGWVGWGPRLHPSQLTPDEQYTHITQWALLAAPLLIGCDLERLDDFTLNLLTNDEVIAIDQDPLGQQASLKITDGDIQIWMRRLADENYAIGIYNLGTELKKYTLDFSRLGFNEKVKIRDVWRQKDLGEKNKLEVILGSHASMLIKVGK